MKLLFRYLRPHTAILSVGLVIKTLGTLVELIIPYISAHIIDNVVPKKSAQQILLWGLGMILCAALALLFNAIANMLAARTSREFTEKLRHDLFESSMRLSCRAADELTVPSLEARITSDTYNLHQMVGTVQRLGVRAPLLLIGGIVITLALDAALSLVMIATLPFISLVVWYITKKGIPLYSRVQKSVDGMTRIVREDAEGIRVIKALSRKEHESARFDRANRALVGIEKKADIVMGLSRPIMQLFLNLGLVAVLLVGAYRVNGGLTEAGKIIAFLQYFTLISNAMLVLTRIFVIYSKGIASAARVEEVLNTESELSVKKQAPRRLEPYLRFEHVSFAYHEGKPILKDIDFSLEKGQTLGIIGATGSGKCTLAKLLLRFYDVSEGSVRIDGIDVRQIPEKELHSRFGVVLQNDFVGADSVRENIDFGRNIDDRDIELAAARAQASEFIEGFSDGYAHDITAKGTNLSGGQRQRLLISRALAGNPDILILDDASSALDYKTDLVLRRAIAEQGHDTTVILIAQRISSVMNADLILVLDEGRIIGRGNHEELMETCPVYREISDSQMGGAFLE
ncbi:MAG: ABC transporter ATP-binding protein [Clostridia bacterium]|nr:ABC transporter ATP-binding protein [Clostridia bacterium]